MNHAIVEATGGGMAEAQHLVFRDGFAYVAGTGGVRRYDGTTGAFVDQFASGISRASFMLFTPETSAVPEPSSLIIFGTGIVILGGYSRLRKTRPTLRRSGPSNSAAPDADDATI